MTRNEGRGLAFVIEEPDQCDSDVIVPTSHDIHHQLQNFTLILIFNMNFAASRQVNYSGTSPKLTEEQNRISVEGIGDQSA